MCFDSARLQLLVGFANAKYVPSAGSPVTPPQKNLPFDFSISASPKASLSSPVE